MDASPVRRHQLDALADPTRRAILELLRERPLTAGEIAARFSQQRPAISKHLTLLRTTGWLAESRDRQRRIYSLRNDAVVVVEDWVRRLGDATRGLESQMMNAPVAEEPVHGEPVRLGGMGGFEKRSEISDLKSQMPEADASISETHESAPSGRAERSSFELIFD